jgi:hypothetical protein
VYRVTQVNTLDNMSFTQLMAIDVGVTAIKVKDPTQGPGTAAGVLSYLLYSINQRDACTVHLFR